MNQELKRMVTEMYEDGHRAVSADVQPYVMKATTMITRATSRGELGIKILWVPKRLAPELVAEMRALGFKARVEDGVFNWLKWWAVWVWGWGGEPIGYGWRE